MNTRAIFLITFTCWIQFAESSWFGNTIEAGELCINHLSQNGISSHSSSILQSVSPLQSGDTSDDPERYSRQVYTLGPKAHGLIRTATVYLDGPLLSGLLYECAKNLALSGIRHLVLVTSTPSSESSSQDAYHDSTYDDLGKAYLRAARNEVDFDSSRQLSDADVFVEYIKKLNPSVMVSQVDRATLEGNDSGTDRRVFLCVDRSTFHQVEVNDVARRNGWAFVALETAGVFGRLFCDFGPSFRVVDVDGEVPLVSPLDRLERVMDSDRHILVNSIDGEKHDVSKGDHVEFLLKDGSVYPGKCVVTDVQTPFRFMVEVQQSEEDVDSFLLEMKEQAISFQRVKLSKETSFIPLSDALSLAKIDPAIFTNGDLEKSFDPVRRDTTMACFEALSLFVQGKGRLPTRSDSKLFWKLTKSCLSRSKFELRDGKKFCRNFLRGCLAKLSPMQAFFGAIGSQEVLKSVTGQYNPAKQFLLYDIDEVLPTLSETDEYDDESTGACPSRGLRYILGATTVNRLQACKIFVVGAGAIGCEIIKNLASMAVGTGTHGKLILTDMDTIEKSNLSRQLLFRDSNIGEFKSIAALQAARRFNPAINIEAHTSKVGQDDHNPFDVKFWTQDVHVILNALDNVEARLYVDSQCVAYRKALIDAGTLGPKGNVQVIVPFQSESYASSIDPPEPAIPVCTLKNFPYLIAHTIQWGRELFDDFFVRRPNQANAFADEIRLTSLDAAIFRLIDDKGDEAAREAVVELCQDLIHEISDAENAKVMSLKWASSLAYELFFRKSKDLLEQHPLNSTDETGEPFWSGARRPPKALVYAKEADTSDQELVNGKLIDFVRAAGRLRYETISGRSVTDAEGFFQVEEVIEALEKCYSTLQMSKEPPDHEKSVVDCARESLSSTLNSTPSSKLIPLYFEKDDEKNGHITFINAASNLRAICYSIPPVDKMETRRVAGNIVPAMVTTTAIVSAHSCIELIKLVQGKALKAHRNAFVNLALPFFAFTAPLPAEPILTLGSKSYTIWDRFTIKESKNKHQSGGITLGSVFRRVKRKIIGDEPWEISSVSFGTLMLYADFLQRDDTDLEKPVWDLIDEAIASSAEFDSRLSRQSGALPAPLKRKTNIYDLCIVIEDPASGEEVQLPTVRLERFTET